MKVLLTYLIVFTLAFLANAWKDPCRDHISRCNYYHQPKGLKYVKNVCRGYVKRYCINLCSEACWRYMAKKTTTARPPTTTTTTTTTTTESIRCFDKSRSCSRYASYCQTSIWMKKNCRQMCGFCKGGKRTTTTTPLTTTAAPTTTTTTPTTTTTTPTTTTTTTTPTTTKTTPTTTATTQTTTTTVKPSGCRTKSDDRDCATVRKSDCFSKEIGEIVRCFCPIKCSRKTVETTRNPLIRTSTTKIPETTTKTITTTAPTTKRKKSTSKRTEIPIPNGVCGDLSFYCMVPRLFNPKTDCLGHTSTCIRTCGVCKGTQQDKCSNLKDRALDCDHRNCQHGNYEQRHRNQVKCQRTCCKRNQLY